MSDKAMGKLLAVIIFVIAVVVFTFGSAIYSCATEEKDPNLVPVVLIYPDKTRDTVIVLGDESHMGFIDDGARFVLTNGTKIIWPWPYEVHPKLER